MFEVRVQIKFVWSEKQPTIGWIHGLHFGIIAPKNPSLPTLAQTITVYLFPN